MKYYIVVFYPNYNTLLYGKNNTAGYLTKENINSDEFTFFTKKELKCYKKFWDKFIFDQEILILNEDELMIGDIIK